MEGVVTLIVIAVIVGIIMLGAVGRESHRQGSGKKNLGVMGLLVILLGSLTFSSCVDLQSA